MAHEALVLLGVVQVPVANLYFVRNIGGGVGERQHSKKQARRLADLFSKTVIDHENHRHWIDGYVDQSDVPSILEHVGSSMALHQNNPAGPYPRLSGQRVAYTHGRHRVEASEKLDPQSCWTILLYSTDLAMLTRSRVVQRRTEQFHYEEPYTDGFIYSKLREHIVDSPDYNSWYMRLSTNKQNNFQAINKHPDVPKALDRLIDFPGLIDALKLGNFRKYSAWGLFSEANMCLEHIYSKWSGYTRGNRSVQRCLTPQTVELLEGRAPTVSQSDHEWVRAVFRARMVFSEITDQQQRDELERGILGTSGMIPSLRFFQANMLYLGIAAQIIWSLLVPSELRKTAKAEGLTTLQSALRECWVETEPYVEIREGEFQPVLGPPSFDLAYNTVMVAALRQFAYMAREGPKIERGEPALRLSTDDVNSCESLFQRRAKLLGFRNCLIEQGAARTATPFSPEKQVLELGEDGFLSRIERRCGRPFARVFPIIQEVAFLPRLSEEGELGRITEAFILKDLVRSFLPRCSFNFDLSRRSIHINGPALEVERQLVHSGHGESVSVDLSREINMDHNDYHILDVESTDMDVDTPMASPVAPMVEDEDEDEEDEDVPMEDLFFEPAATEETEDSDFWEQLLLEEYQTNTDTSRSSHLPSDSPTLVVDDLSNTGSLPRGSPACGSSSAFSIPSYSLVADQSRTVFDDSSQCDRSTLWSSSGSENNPGHQSCGDSRDALDIHHKHRLGTENSVIHNGLSTFNAHSTLLHKNGVKGAPNAQLKDRPSRPQLHKALPNLPPLAQRDEFSTESCAYWGGKSTLATRHAPRQSPPGRRCGRQAEVDRPWQEDSPSPQPHALPLESRHPHYTVASVYSTTPERSVLPSPSGSEYRVLEESQVHKAIMAPSPYSDRRFTAASFYTAPHPRSILPSPTGAHQASQSPRKGSQTQGPTRGPWRGLSAASVSAESQSHSADLSQSGHSHAHSHSSISPILSRFSNVPGRFPPRSACETPVWGDNSFQKAPIGNSYALLQKPQGPEAHLADSEDTLTTISLS